MNAISPPHALPPSGASAPALPLGYATAPAAQYALYSPGATGLATFLGGPIAGTAIMAMNYRRLGRSASATKTILWGVLGTAGLIALSFAIGNRAPGLSLAIVPVVVVLQLARSLQGETFSRHKVAGGKVASMWKAAGIGIASMVGLLAIIVSIAVAADLAFPSNKRLAVGSSEILYSGTATTGEAQALGNALSNDGYFGSGKTTTVLLARKNSDTTLQFVVNETAALDDNTVAIFTAITQDVAPSIGGKPITLQLVNPQLKVLKTKKIDE